MIYSRPGKQAAGRGKIVSENSFKNRKSSRILPNLLNSLQNSFSGVVAFQ